MPDQIICLITASTSEVNQLSWPLTHRKARPRLLNNKLAQVLAPTLIPFSLTIHNSLQNKRIGRLLC